MSQRAKNDVEVKLQTASQDYDCDFCPEPIHDETKYVRVALVAQRGRRPDGLPSAGMVEKFHPDCYTVLTGEIVNG